MASNKKWHSYVLKSIKVGLQDHFKEEAQPQPCVRKDKVDYSNIQLMSTGMLFVAMFDFK